jgi:hypothetical protein
MKTIASRKVAMVLGGILTATLAAGCFGGGGYWGRPSGYNSSDSSYGSSYPYSGYDSRYSYPQSYGNSYSAGYQNGVRADENRDRHQDRDTVVIRDRGEARTEAQHSSVDRDKYSRKDYELAHPLRKTDRHLYF